MIRPNSWWHVPSNLPFLSCQLPLVAGMLRSDHACWQVHEASSQPCRDSSASMYFQPAEAAMSVYSKINTSRAQQCTHAAVLHAHAACRVTCTMQDVEFRAPQFWPILGYDLVASHATLYGPHTAGQVHQHPPYWHHELQCTVPVQTGKALQLLELHDTLLHTRYASHSETPEHGYWGAQGHPEASNSRYSRHGYEAPREAPKLSISSRHD